MSTAKSNQMSLYRSSINYTGACGSGGRLYADYAQPAVCTGERKAPHTSRKQDKAYETQGQSFGQVGLRSSLPARVSAGELGQELQTRFYAASLASPQQIWKIRNGASG